MMRAAKAPGATGPLCVSPGPCPSASTNWSGYAQTSGPHTFTEVTDTFVVPTVSAVSAGRQFAADWVGIGGFSDPTLVQAGFQTVVKKKGKKTTVTYGAWTEILPQAEDPLSLTVAAGDVVTVNVQETAKNMWTMTVDDTTTGLSGARTVAYRSKGMSVEAIHERPCIKAPCSDAGDLAELAKTSDVTFDPGSFSEAPPGAAPQNEPLLTTTVPAAGPPETTLWDVVMTNDDGNTVIATPSDPNTAADGFTVADGASPPLPPA